MAKNGTEFSKYAQAFREVIDGNKSNYDVFTRDLLKMGLTINDKAYIDDKYPTYKDDKGVRRIAGNKGDILRKYYGGTNDLSKLIPELETEFDEEFRERYCEELQDYDESRIMKFARDLNIAVNEDDIDIVSEAIADYYTSIVIGSAIKKSEKGKKVKDDPESDRNKILLSYTLEDPEKKALVKLCKLIKTDLRKLKQQTDIICNKKHELKKLTTSEADKRWKPHLEFDIISSEKRFNEDFPKLEKLCTKLISLLEPKTDMDEEFSKLVSFANNIGNDEYKITCPSDFKYNHFAFMVSNFNASIDRVIRAIDKLK